jgi:hypothetical protein
MASTLISKSTVDNEQAKRNKGYRLYVLEQSSIHVSIGHLARATS